MSPPPLDCEQIFHFSHHLPCMATVEFPESLENVWVTIWNGRCHSWACGRGLRYQNTTPEPHLEMHPRNMWSAVSCLVEEVMEGENERSPVAIRKGGRPMEKTTLGSWNELVDHFSSEGGFHLLSNIREGLQTPWRICHQEGEITFLTFPHKLSFNIFKPDAYAKPEVPLLLLFPQ